MPKHPKPGWTGLGATRSSQRCRCLWQGGGPEWALRAFSAETILQSPARTQVFFTPAQTLRQQLCAGIQGSPTHPRTVLCLQDSQAIHHRSMVLDTALSPVGCPGSTWTNRRSVPILPSGPRIPPARGTWGHKERL